MLDVLDDRWHACASVRRLPADLRSVTARPGGWVPIIQLFRRDS